MATIQELKEQLRIEKNKTKALQEIRDIGKERKVLRKEIKNLRLRRKFAKTIRASKALASGARKFGRGLAVAGKVIGEAEERSRKKKLSQQAKTSSTPRKKSFEDIINSEILK